MLMGLFRLIEPSSYYHFWIVIASFTFVVAHARWSLNSCFLHLCLAASQARRRQFSRMTNRPIRRPEPDQSGEPERV